VLDRLKLPVHDRLDPSEFSLEIRISQHSHRSDRSGEPVRPVKQQVGLEFVLQNSSVKRKEKVEQSTPEDGSA
jgi:hypothetical protein